MPDEPIKKRRGRPPKQKPDESSAETGTESVAGDDPKPKFPRPPAADYDMQTRLAIAKETRRRGEHGVRDLIRESEGGYVSVEGVGRLKVKKLAESTVRGWVRKIDYFEMALKVGEAKARGIVSPLAALRQRNEALESQLEEITKTHKALDKELKRVKGKLDRLVEYDLAFVLEGVELSVAEKGVCKMRFMLMEPEMRAVARRTCLDFVETYINNLRPLVERMPIQEGDKT